MKFRVIYEITKYNNDGALAIRRFASNKRLAEKIARQIGAQSITKHNPKNAWVDPREVETR